MNISEIINNNIDIYIHPYYGESFRCSVYLHDNTYLPCVVIRKSNNFIELACKRIKEELSGNSVFKNKDYGFREIVKIFATYGNRIDESEIAYAEVSRFATPTFLLEEIQEETLMSWTSFVLEMNDGNRFSFGSSHDLEFFDLPSNYSFSDVFKIYNHSYVGEKNNIINIKNTSSTSSDFKNNIYREKSFFLCYIE